MRRVSIKSDFYIRGTDHDLKLYDTTRYSISGSSSLEPNGKEARFFWRLRELMVDKLLEGVTGQAQNLEQILQKKP
jgi:hypothetical protein